MLKFVIMWQINKFVTVALILKGLTGFLKYFSILLHRSHIFARMCKLDARMNLVFVEETIEKRA